MPRVPSLLLATAAALLLAGGATARREVEPVPLLVSSRLPEWLAPGAALDVRGTAAPDTVVTVEAAGKVVAGSISGADGRFRVRATFDEPGRHRLTVSTGTERQPLGRLLVRPLRLAAVGDVTFGANVGAAIAAHGTRYPWLLVSRVLRGADVATANLEGVVSTRGEPVPGKQYHFRGPPAALAAAAGVGGLDVVSLANNHSLDYGRDAFLDTLRHARRYGVRTVGGGATLAAARRPARVTAGGLRVAFLGYSDVRPLGFTATVATAGVAPAEPSLIEADVRAAKRSADVVVVWFHWGQELARTADARQAALAAAALNAGASVVLGAHPHVLQPVVRPSGGTLVAWSLGNFVFAANSPRTEQTGILLVHLGTRGVRAHRLAPARIEGVRPRLVPSARKTP